MILKKVTYSDVEKSVCILRKMLQKKNELKMQKQLAKQTFTKIKDEIQKSEQVTFAIS